MNPEDFTLRVYNLQKASIRAIPFIPRRSKYRTMAYEALGETLPAWKMIVLEKRLIRFAKENKEEYGK